MRIRGLFWLGEIVDKLEWKHAVSQHEVHEVFSSKPYFRFVEKGRSKGEDVFAALGQTLAGRYLIAFFIHTSDNMALILSAREMTKRERKLYAKR